MARRIPAQAASLFAGVTAVLILLTIAGVRLAGDKLFNYQEQVDYPFPYKKTLIVALTGGPGRIESAIQELEDKKGLHLFIAGAGSKSSRKKIFENLSAPVKAKIDSEMSSMITIERESRNTLENAYAVEKYLKDKPHIENIILVTASYHMKRSLFIFRTVFEDKYYIAPRTARYRGSITRTNWMKSGQSIFVVLDQFGKYFLARTFFPFLKKI